MLPLLIGLSTAALFGLVTGSVYGAEALVQETWVVLVFWGLITGSAMMTLVRSRTESRGDRRTSEEDGASGAHCF